MNSEQTEEAVWVVIAILERIALALENLDRP